MTDAPIAQDPNPEQRRVLKRALVSVYDKSGLEELVRGLHDAGVELVSTGGSARLIADLGLPVTKVTSTTMTLGSTPVTFTGAKVLSTTASNRRRIPLNTKVAVLYFTAKRKNGVVEVALLPATSKL